MEGREERRMGEKKRREGGSKGTDIRGKVKQWSKLQATLLSKWNRGKKVDEKERRNLKQIYVSPSAFQLRQEQKGRRKQESLQRR